MPLNSGRGGDFARTTYAIEYAIEKYSSIFSNTFLSFSHFSYCKFKRKYIIKILVLPKNRIKTRIFGGVRGI